jgi:hypothetical protein
MSTKNLNHKVVDNVFWRGGKSMLVDGTLEHIYVERRVESFPTQGKVCNQTSNVDSNNLAKGHLRDICQQEAYASNGPGQTIKTGPLGSGPIQQFAFLVEGFVHDNQTIKGRF